MPVAVNCFVCPVPIEAMDGVTAMETTAAAVTVSVTGPLLTAPELAVMVDVPTLMLVARPTLPASAVSRRLRSTLRQTAGQQSPRAR